MKKVSPILQCSMGRLWVDNLLIDSHEGKSVYIVMVLIIDLTNGQPF